MTQDDGEPPLIGVEVTAIWAGPDGLFGGADDETYAVTTGTDGRWQADLLPSGQYRISVPNGPGGYVATYDTDGVPYSVTATDAADGDTQLGIDFAYRGPHSVGDTVYWDLDGDQTQSPGEPGVEGVKITLVWEGMDLLVGTADDVSVTVTTDRNGHWLVGGIGDGIHDITVDETTLPEGASIASDLDGGDSPHTAVDVLGDDRLDVDYPVDGNSALRGIVWDDRNGNGLRDHGEDGVGGVELTITWIVNDEDPTQPNPTVTIVTNPDGTWQVGNLPPGRYTVEITGGEPDGYGPTTPTGAEIEIAAGEEATFEAGLAVPVQIETVVFYDTDQDGIFDADEEAVAGAVIRIVRGEGAQAAQTATDSHGKAAGKDLTPGSYVVIVDHETLPQGAALVSESDGVVDGQVEITLLAGENGQVMFGIADGGDGGEGGGGGDDGGGGGGDGGGDGGRLPHTGERYRWTLGASILLLGAGAEILRRNRRHQNNPPQP